MDKTYKQGLYDGKFVARKEAEAALAAERALADRLAAALRTTVPCITGNPAFWWENENTAKELAAYDEARKDGTV